MSLLKRIGQILAQGTAIALGIGPLVFPGKTGELGQVVGILEQVSGLVVQIEAIGVSLGLSGAQKLQGVVTAAMQLFLDSALLAGHKIANANLFKEGVTDVVNGIVKILNSAKSDGVETENKIG